MELIWVTKAEYVREYKIALTFNNGVKKVVDLSHRLVGSMFKPLRDLEEFKKFRLNSWTIEWDNGADFAPEYLYSL